MRRADERTSHARRSRRLERLVAWLVVLSSTGCGAVAPPARRDGATGAADTAGGAPRTRPTTEELADTVLPDDTGSSNAAATPDFVSTIPDREVWAQLAAPSDEHATARTEVVKVLLDHATHTLYFMQSRRWPIHYDFARRFLETDARPLGDRAGFNRSQYLTPSRTMQLASLVYYRDADLFTLELGPADNLDAAGLLALFLAVGDAVFFGERLRYRPRSVLHERRARRVLAALRAIDVNDEIWASVRYQPVTLGAAVGRLRIVSGPLDPASVLPDQILVLDHVPNDVPLCAAIITGELQAPLAHVAVLSQSRGTPDMALRADLATELARYDDHIVRLEVGAADYTIRDATAEELRASLAAHRPPPVAPPTLDAGPTALRDTCDLRLTDVGSAGAKAAQLGEVCGLGVETSAGFVVPVSRYLAHLRRNAIDATAAPLRAIEGFETDGRTRERALAARRARIEEAPIDGSLLHDIAARIRRHPRRRWIFRSSTNAEDLPGFSGAGLYVSVVTERDPDADAIARAMREVWASVWSRRAWDEREYYRVDHDAVAMAVLVQPLVTDLAAIGVAITENPFSTRRSGMLVNLAPPAGSVTAAGASLPEQILLYRHTRPEVISRSADNGGRPLLTPAAARSLSGILQRIHDHMLPRWGERADAADVELALRRDGGIVILQARPYRMR